VTVTARRLALLIVIVLSQCALFEAGLRLHAGSEAAPGFRALFMPDDETGYRLRPGARTRFATREFETDIDINDAGVRDLPIGPKAPGERRIVILGDSLVLAVQVPLDETFGKRLERRLNATAVPGVPGVRYRVINAGVQGYGPVEELFFYQKVAAAFDPDLVLVSVFVGNDASEALQSAWRLSPSRHDDPPAESTVTALRRLARSSMVGQIARMRLQTATDRFGTHAPERPLKVYLDEPSPDIDKGLAVTRETLAKIDRLAAARGARTALVLMPARLQVDDADYGRLAQTVREAGGTMVRDGATNRFREALAPLRLPMLDPLPAFRRTLPGPDIFFQSTVHLTPHGHEVLADALDAFVREQGLLAPNPAPGPALEKSPLTPNPLSQGRVGYLPPLSPAVPAPASPRAAAVLPRERGDSSALVAVPAASPRVASAPEAGSR
jgi:lysophospholipase L1-like esterase